MTSSTIDHDHHASASTATMSELEPETRGPTAVAVAPSLSVAQRGPKACPHCAGHIQSTARVCEHCQGEIVVLADLLYLAAYVASAALALAAPPLILLTLLLLLWQTFDPRNSCDPTASPPVRGKTRRPRRAKHDRARPTSPHPRLSREEI